MAMNWMYCKELRWKQIRLGPGTQFMRLRYVKMLLSITSIP